jgi:hypothetical protein
LLAIVTALAVPTAQLRTFTVVASCCCPDPAKCHCPDHKPDHSGQPGMRSCHRTSHEIVSPDAPSFSPPELAMIAPPARIATPVIAALPVPHASNAIAPPYGPS